VELSHSWPTWSWIILSLIIFQLPELGVCGDDTVVDVSAVGV
jgi:hypothetical protein